MIKIYKNKTLYFKALQNAHKGRIDCKSYKHLMAKHFSTPTGYKTEKFKEIGFTYEHFKKIPMELRDTIIPKINAVSEEILLGKLNLEEFINSQIHENFNNKLETENVIINKEYSESRRTAVELKVEDLTLPFTSNPLFDLLENNIKEIHKEYDPLLLQDLKIKWSFLQKILNEKESKTNFKKVQQKIETEIIRLNELHHEKGTIYTNLSELLGDVYEKTKTPWSFYEGPPACVHDYFDTVSLNYDPTRLLISAFGEVIASAGGSEEAVRMKQTTFILRLYKHFHKIYEKLEYLKCKRKNIEFIPKKHSDFEKYQIGSFLTFRLRVLKIVDRKKEANRFKGEFFIVIEKYRHTSNSLYINIESLPMLCIPKPWENVEPNKLEIRKGDVQPTLMVKGGYLKEHSFDQKLYDHSKYETLDPHVIYGTDTMYLELSARALESVNYIQETAFKINLENLDKVLANLRYYLEKEENLTFFQFESITDYVKAQPKSEGATDNQHYKYNASLYAIELMKFRKVIITLFLAILFKNLKFYYVVYADFRSRLYRHGWPLNPMGNILSKLLLQIDGQTYKTRKEATTTLDACASGFSIYGMLSGDKRLLELTRILKNDNKDFYLYMLAFLEKEIPFLDKLKHFNGDNLISRNYLKNILIPFMYNEGIKGTFKTLDGIDQLRDQVLRHIKDKKDPVFYLASSIRKNLDLCFPNVPKVKKFLNYIIDCNFENRSLNLMDHLTNGYITSKMFYPEVIEQSIRVSIWKDQTMAKIQAIKQPRTLDKNKCKVAAAPNMIHSLDAFLMLETIQNLKEKKVPVSTIHDCFMVLKSDREKTQLAYQEAVKSLMKNDFLLTVKENPNNLVNYQINANNQELPKKEVEKFLRKLKAADKILNEMKINRASILEKEEFSNEPLKEDEAVFEIKGK